jgi:hypothetical protein
MTGVITVGQRISNWEVLSVDPSGKRVTCRCVCGIIRVIGLTALESGACRSCGCSPLSPQQRDELRAEQTRRSDGWRT